MVRWTSSLRAVFAGILERSWANTGRSRATWCAVLWNVLVGDAPLRRLSGPSRQLTR